MYSIRKPTNVRCPNCGYNTCMEVIRKFRGYTRYVCTVCGQVYNERDKINTTKDLISCIRWNTSYNKFKKRLETNDFCRNQTKTKNKLKFLKHKLKGE